MKAVTSAGSAADRDRVRVRRRVNPASPPTTLELHGVRIHFPFKPYECQEAYMKKVLEALLRGENALLESPTGTGKTLCLLCSALAWQRDQSILLRQQKAEAVLSQPQVAEKGGTTTQPASRKQRVPTIVYASRTHSQLSQVVRELRNTRYRPQHAVLGSREQMCVNPKVKKPTSTGADINHDCNRLGKNRKCMYRNNLEGFTPPSNEEGGTGCQPVMDMEDLVKMGTEHKVCPFYYTRSQVEKAELVLVPYNYLFDQEAKETIMQAIDWKNAVIIVDEAHNLESFASESASFDLSHTDIASCIRDIDKTMNLLSAMDDPTHGLKGDNLIKLKMILKKLEDFVDNLGSQNAYGGEFMLEIFRQAHITHAVHGLLIDELRKVNDFLMDMKGAKRGSASIEHFIHCLKRVYGHPLEARCLAKAAFYRVYVSPKATDKSGGGRTVSYWCFAPSLAMEELQAKSIIVTSGTLAPLKGLSLELGIKFPHTLENPHIISEKQIHVRVIGKGVSGKTLSSSYERRKDDEYYSELGNTLVSLAKIIPDGMLIFFPSYGVMETCIERWGGPSRSHAVTSDKSGKFFAQRPAKQPSKKCVFVCAPTIYFDDASPRTPWKRLISTKSVVVEPRSTAELADAIAEFQRLIKMPKSRGCILMGVCRGKISEGIDFAHEQSRAVIITGLPFPPTHDPKVKMKREYLDCIRAQHVTRPSGEAGFEGDMRVSSSDMLSGHEWYTQQAHRAVNQAIGRVIRNRSDYGAVILLDDRFSHRQNKDGLSKWLRPHIKDDEGFGAVVRGLVTFYKEADIKVKQIAQEDAAAKSVILEYEDEDDQFTKIAFVQLPGNEHENAINASSEVARDAEAHKDFVPPSQIISRVDVKELQTNSDVNHSKTARSTSEDKPVGYDAVFKRDPIPAAHTESLASQFFRKAKSLLKPTELVIVKKAVVAMKTHAEKKDNRSYSEAARKVIELINRHEHLESTGKCKEGEPRMLLLFLDLQSKPYKEQIQKMAMEMVLESSKLGHLCSHDLVEPYRNIAHSCMISLLFHIWCTQPAGLERRQKFFEQSKEVLMIFLKADRLVSSSLVNAYKKLIPPAFSNDAQALIDQLVATMKVEKMKAADKSRKGEASVNSNQFKAASVNLVKEEPSIAPLTVKQNPGKDENSLVTKRALEHSGSLNNPYSKKPMIRTDVVKTTSDRKDSGDHRASASLPSILEKVEQSGPYIPPAIHLANAAKSLQKKSNRQLAKNLVCPICTQTNLKEPFIAECGHVACLDCWKRWLSRSDTCPTCRKHSSKDTIARLVFQPHSGNEVASSKVASSEVANVTKPLPEAEESSEDELEIT